MTTSPPSVLSLDMYPVPFSRRHTPWTIDELATGLAALPSIDSYLTAALALALPVSCVSGIQVRTTRDQIIFRGCTAELGDMSLGDTVRAVTQLMDQTTLPSDTFADPTGPPSTWARVLRSGARNVLFGAHELFGAPLIAADPEVPEAALYAYLDAWISNPVTASRTRLRLGDLDLRKHGDRASVVLTLTTPTTTAKPAAVSSRQLMTQVASEIGATLVELVEMTDGLLDAIFDLDGRTIVVPAALSSSSAAVGYRGGLMPTLSGPDDPTLAGWTVLGPAAREPGWVMVHDASRLRALLSSSS